MTPEHERQLNEFTNRVLDCTRKLETHISDNNKHVEGVEAALTAIKENHLAHIQTSMGKMQIHLAKIATNQNWLMKSYWVVATASIGGLITAVFALLTT